MGSKIRAQPALNSPAPLRATKTACALQGQHAAPIQVLLQALECLPLQDARDKLRTMCVFSCCSSASVKSDAQRESLRMRLYSDSTAAESVSHPPMLSYLHAAKGYSTSCAGRILSFTTTPALVHERQCDGMLAGSSRVSVVGAAGPNRDAPAPVLQLGLPFAARQALLCPARHSHAIAGAGSPPDARGVHRQPGGCLKQLQLGGVQRGGRGS